jgi:hypothetical protein
VFHAAAAVTTGLAAPGRIYVIGGSLADGGSEVLSTNLTQVYDPKTDSWAFGSTMPTSRSHLTLTNVNDTLYAIGGEINYHYQPTPANEKYVPPGNGWSSSQSQSASPTGTPTPSPSVPELPSWIILPLLLASTLLLTSLIKLRGNRHPKKIVE